MKKEAKDGGGGRGHLMLLSVVVLLSILLRFYNLEAVPAWDFDEGYNMRYAFDLLNGQVLWFAIKYAFIPHPPLFFLAYAAVIKFLGVGVYTLRLLTASYGVVTTVVLYLTGREMFNRNIGLAASFIYAVTPEVVFWNRVGHANNQLMLLSALTLYFIYRYSKTLDGRMLHLGCLAAGLSVVTEYTGLFNVAAMAVFLYLYHRRQVLKAVAFSLLPLAMLFVFMLHYSPDYFLFDLSYQLNRFFSVGKIALAIVFALVAYRSRELAKAFYKPIAESIDQDTLVYLMVVSLVVFQTSESSFWRATSFLFVMSFFGLCLMPSFQLSKEKERRILVLFLVFNILSLLAFDRADHMTMVVYPFASVAVAAMFYGIYRKSVAQLPWILRRFRLKLSSRTLFVLAFYPVFVSLCFSSYMFLLGNFSMENVAEDLAVAEYVNQRAGAGDLILTYSWMFPMIREARVSLLTQSIAYEGDSIAYYSGDFPPERFAFNTSYRRAKFLVASNGTLEWVLNETGLNDTVAYLECWEETPVAGFLVYSNPEYRPA